MFSGTGSPGLSWIEAVKQDVANVTYLMSIRRHEICSRGRLSAILMNVTSRCPSAMCSSLVCSASVWSCARQSCAVAASGQVGLIEDVVGVVVRAVTGQRQSYIHTHTLISPPTRGQMALLYKRGPPSENVAKRPHIDLNI